MSSKRIITLFTAMIFLLGLVAFPASAAPNQTEAVLTIEGENLQAGAKNVEVPIKAFFVGKLIELNVSFDNRYLTYTGIEKGAVQFLVKNPSVDGTKTTIGMSYPHTAFDPNTYDNDVLSTLKFDVISEDNFKALSVTELETKIEIETNYNTAGDYRIYNFEGKPFAPGKVTFNDGDMTIKLKATAPEIDGAVTIDKTAPKVGDVLKASYTYKDINGDPEDTAAQSVEWLVGGVSKATTTKAGTYTVTADDFGKTIVAKATPTSTVEPKTGTAKSSAATLAVAADLTKVASVSNLAFAPTSFISGTPVVLSYTFTCPNGGNDASDIAWTYEDGSAVAGTISADKKTYTPAPGDMDKKIKVTVTPKSDRNPAAGTAVSLVSLAGVIVGDPKVSNVEWDADSIVVNRTATVSYTFEDAILEDDAENKTTVVFEWANAADATEWNVFEAGEDVVLTSDLEEGNATITLGLNHGGKFVKATVTPKNQHGVEGEAEVVGPLEVLAGNPVASNAKWGVSAITLNRSVTVTYDFTDDVLEDAEDNTAIVFEWADSKDAAEWNAFAVDEHSSISGATIALRAFYKGKFVKATITPKNQHGVEGTPVVLEAIEVRASSGGGTGGGSGSTLPPVNPTPTPDVTPGPTTGPVGIEKFVDVPKDKYNWAVEGIDVLVKADVIRGVTSTTFEPEKTLTRAEFTAMVIRALELEDDNAKATYSDVATSYWGYLEISSAQELGIVDFFGDTFAPEQAITRDEMVALLYNAADVADITLPTTATAEDFTDASSVAEYAVEALEALQKAGIINGMGDGTFAPKGETTRAQASKVVFLVYKLK